jgi:hypothetical protein
LILPCATTKSRNLRCASPKSALCSLFSPCTVALGTIFMRKKKIVLYFVCIYGLQATGMNGDTFGWIILPDQMQVIIFISTFQQQTMPLHGIQLSISQWCFHSIIYISTVYFSTVSIFQRFLYFNGRLFHRKYISISDERGKLALRYYCTLFGFGSSKKILDSFGFGYVAIM